MAGNLKNLFIFFSTSYAVIIAANQFPGKENETVITIHQSNNQKLIVYRNAIKHECYIESIAATSTDQSQNSKTLFVGKSEMNPSNAIFAELGRDVTDLCNEFAIFQLEWQPFSKHLMKKRQTNPPKQSYFKGQTQTQFISFDDGRGKDEKAGIAEAIAEQDKSRATVQGRIGMGQAQSQSTSGDPCAECAATANQLQGAGQFGRSFEYAKPSTTSSIFVDSSAIPATNNGAVNTPFNPFPRQDVQFGERIPSHGQPSAAGTQTNLHSSPYAPPFDPSNVVGSRNYPFSNSHATSQTPSFEAAATIPSEFQTTNEPGGRYVPNSGPVFGRQQPERGQIANSNVAATGLNPAQLPLQPQPQPASTPSQASNTNIYSGQDVANQRGLAQSSGGKTPIGAGPVLSPPYHSGQTTQGDVSNYPSLPATTHTLPGTGSSSLYPQQGFTSSQNGGSVYPPGTYGFEPSYGGGGGDRDAGYRPTSGIATYPDGHAVNAAPVVPWSPVTGVIDSQPTGYYLVPRADGFQSVVYNQQAIPTARVPSLHVIATYPQYVAQTSNAGGIDTDTVYPNEGTGVLQGAGVTYPRQVTQSQLGGGQTPGATFPQQAGHQTPYKDAFTYPDGRMATSQGGISTYPQYATHTLYPGGVGYPGGRWTATYPQQQLQTSPNNALAYPQHRSLEPGSGGNAAGSAPQQGTYPAPSGIQFGISHGAPAPAPTTRLQPSGAAGNGAINNFLPPGENQRNGYAGGWPNNFSPTDTNRQIPYGGQTGGATPTANVNYYPTPTATRPLPVATSFPSTWTTPTYDTDDNQRGRQPTLINAHLPTSTTLNAGPIQGGEKGVDVSQGSQITAVDTLGGESQSTSSINVSGNDTKAVASAQGKTRNGKAQAQVSGTYTGSFSAQAQTSDDEKSVESQIFGNSSGALSSSQGRAGKSGSQSQIRYSHQTGSSIAEAQGSGINYNTNSQIQAATKGGIADAQSSGSGSSASQAQIGFLPFDGKRDQVSIFEGGGTSSAQNDAFSGQSQSQLQGSFKFGSSFVGSAQSSAGRNQNTTKLAYNSTRLSLLNAKQETDQPIDASEKSTDGDTKKSKSGSGNGVMKSLSPLSPSSKTRNDYVDGNTRERNEMLTNAQNDQHSASSNRDQSLFVKSRKFDAYIYKDSTDDKMVSPAVLHVPKGFSGKIASSAGDITQATATSSGHAQTQTQTVKLKPSPARVTIDDRGRQPTMQTVQNDVIIYDDEQVKSSNCGHFTFTCNLIQGSNGRTKICKPSPSTYSDGTPC